MKKRIAASLTDEQLSYLAEHYPYTPNDVLANELGISIHTINSRRTRHGWKKNNDFLKKIRHDSAINHRSWERLNIKETHAKGIETRNKIYEAEKIRIKWGLPQLTKRRFASEPRKKRMQRNYLKRIGYIIDDVQLIAYYTPETHRAKRLERVNRGEEKGTIKPYYDFKPYNYELQ